MALALSAWAFLPGRAEAALNVDQTDFVLCNGCSEAQRIAAAGEAIPLDGGQWTIIIVDNNSSAVYSYKGIKEYDLEFGVLRSRTHATINDLDAIESVQIARQMIANLNSARVSVSAGALWEVNGVLASPMSAGVLPIPIPTNVPGADGPVTSASNVFSNTATEIAVSNYLRLVSVAGTSPRSGLLAFLTKFFQQTQVPIVVIFADGSTMSYRLSGLLDSALPYEALFETARDANGNPLVTSGGGGGGGSGGGTASGGSGGGIFQFDTVCVTGTVTSDGGFLGSTTTCFLRFWSIP